MAAYDRFYCTLNEPGPSHINSAYESTDGDSDLETDIPDEDKCCIRKKS